MSQSSNPPALIRASTGFACDLWRQIAPNAGNLAVSPASISLAMAMTWAGARRDTAAQIADVFGFGEPDDVHPAAGSLIEAWSDPDAAYELCVLNRLFGDASLAFERPFLDVTELYYAAGLEPIDLCNAPEPSRRHINDWVAGRTRDRIQDLLPPRSIAPDTGLVLINAVYFLAKWEQQFATARTKPRAFHAPRGQVSVPTMNHTGEFEYARADGAHVVQMRYRGRRFAMVVLLPDRVDGLADLEQRLSPQVLDRWLGGLRMQAVHVALPGFGIDPPASLALKQTLRAMGVEYAFKPGVADFTGIANPPDPGDALCIGQVFHKAFIKVDEAGTEAAAATAVSMLRCAPPPEPIEFHVDRPFLFLIRDVDSDAILFMGRVVDPTAD